MAAVGNDKVFWRVVLAAAAISAIVVALRAYPIHIVVSLPDPSKHHAEFGQATAITGITALLTTVFAGMASDRFGAARTVAFGILAAALGLELFRTTQPGTSWNLIAVLFGIGVGAAGSGLLLSVVAQRVSTSRRTLAVLTFAALPLIGRAAWPLVELSRGSDAGPVGAFFRLLAFTLSMEWVEKVLKAFEWQATAAIGAVLVLLCWPLSRPSGRTSGEGGLTDAARTALRLPSYWLLGASSLLAGTATFISAHQAIFLKDYGLDYRTTYATLAAFSMGGLVGMLFAGCARDLSVKNQLALLSLGRAAAFLCFLLLPLSQVGAFADFFLLGAFLLPVLPLTAVLTDKLIGTRWLATLFGVQSVLYGIGGALGVFLSGSLYDAFKSYHPALWLACVASIVAAAACYFIREAVDTSDTKEAAAPLRA